MHVCLYMYMHIIKWRADLRMYAQQKKLIDLAKHLQKSIFPVMTNTIFHFFITIISFEIEIYEI